MTDDETARNTTQTVTCGYSCCCDRTLPLAFGTLVGRFHQYLVIHSPSNVVCLIAVQRRPVANVRSCCKEHSYISDSDLAGEAQHHKADN